MRRERVRVGPAALAAFLTLVLVPVVAAAPPAQAVKAPSETALVVLRADRGRDFDDVLALTRRLGGDPTVAYAPAAFMAVLPPAAEAELARHRAVSRIERGPVDPAGDERARTAIAAWNATVAPATAAEGQAPHPPPPTPDGPDVLVAPPEATASEGPAATPSGAPGPSQTSEFMAGSVAVSVVFVESSGGIGNCSPADVETENWDPARRATALAKVGEGLSFWTARSQAPRPLTFFVDDVGVQPTSCEPISRPQTDEGRWIADVLTGLGFPATRTDYWGRVRDYDNARRTALGTDWAVTVFVVDSLADADGAMTDGYSGYAYLNGPFIVMTYDNGGWGISRMHKVFRHELGHSFGALDEYRASGCSPGQVSGYLGVANASCNNGGLATDVSVMGEGSELDNAGVDVSTPARGAIGWRNPAPGTGTGAVVDVVRTSTAAITPLHPDPTTDARPAVNATATNVAFPPGPNRSPVSISRVAGAEAAVDSAPWSTTGVVPGDGAFDGPTEAYTVTPESDLPPGVHAYATRTVNDFGHVSADASATVTVARPAAPTIDSNDHATFTVGIPANFAITASGLPAPTMTLTGTRPTGISFDPTTAMLSGTPAAGTAGTYALAVRATNGVAPDALQAFTLTVDPGAVIVELTALPVAAASLPYTATLTAHGGVPPYSWAVTAGSLPAGLVLVPATGEITGVPVEAGTGSFTVTATDASTPARTASLALSLAVDPDRALFTYPRTGDAGVDTTRPFTWSGFAGAEGYYVVVGTTLHGHDLVNSGVLPAAQLSLAVPSLPADRTVYATVFTLVGGAWSRYESVSFTPAPGEARLTYPAGGQHNVDTAWPFAWSTIPAAEGHILVVGTAPFGSDLVNSGVLPPEQTSFTIPAMPAGILHATLVTRIQGTWTRYQAITFTADAGKAQLTYPFLAAEGVDTTKPFTWAPVPQAQGYYLAVGTTFFGSDLVNSGPLPPTRTSFAVPSLPAGRTLIATLFTAVGGNWQRYSVVFFTAAPGEAQFTYPVPGQPGVDTSQPFTWSTVPGAEGHVLVVGTSLHASDLVNSGVLPADQTSYRVPSLPAGTLHATIITKLNGVWSRYQDIVFSADPGQGVITSPADGQLGYDTTQPITWTPVRQAEAYYLVVGTSPYGWDLVNSGVLLPAQSSFALPPLPAGTTLYATLVTRVGGAWSRTHVVSFTAAPR